MVVQPLEVDADGAEPDQRKRVSAPGEHVAEPVEPLEEALRHGAGHAVGVGSAGARQGGTTMPLLRGRRDDGGGTKYRMREKMFGETSGPGRGAHSRGHGLHRPHEPRLRVPRPWDGSSSIAMIDVPAVQYARSGDVDIAYQVVGDGPFALVFVQGWVSNIEYVWEEPTFARFLRRLASFSRLILFDKRGTGLSDRVGIDELPTLEQRMDDVRAVMDAVGVERAALLGVSEGGPMCVLFAATYPERTDALVMIGAYARRLWAEDYRPGATPEEYAGFLRAIEEGWGGPVGLEIERRACWDARFRAWWATYLRMSASPGAAYALTRMNGEIDVRHALPTVGVPTLIVHRVDDRSLPVEGSRYMADRIPGAKLVELPGDDHLPWVGPQDEILDEVEEFLTGVRRGAEPDRVLATVLFTDVVRSTEHAAELGDKRWRDLLGASPLGRATRADALAWNRDRHHRRRLPGDVRRPCPRRPLRVRGARCGA